jgi:hypothetical protein
MSSRDIVNQMTDEMGMNQQMLQNMQMQQVSQFGQPMPQMMPQQPGMDFGQLSPEQQMMMMQQAAQGPQQPSQEPPEFDDSSSSISSSSSGSGSTDADLNALGLGSSSNGGMFESLLNYLKDPLIVIVLIALLNITQVESLVKSVIPYAFGYGVYFTGIKALIGGLVYLAIKLVL